MGDEAEVGQIKVDQNEAIKDKVIGLEVILEENKPSKQQTRFPVAPVLRGPIAAGEGAGRGSGGVTTFKNSPLQQQQRAATGGVRHV